MKLWILEPKVDLQKDNPWDPWYDKCFGVVVRSRNEKRARVLAGDAAKEEGRDAWENAAFSTCIQLTHQGEEGVVIQNNQWA